MMAVIIWSWYQNYTPETFIIILVFCCEKVLFFCSEGKSHLSLLYYRKSKPVMCVCLQGMHVDLEQENSNVKDLERQTLEAQNRLQEMEQQRGKLENKVAEAKSKAQEESSKVR